MILTYQGFFSVSTCALPCAFNPEDTAFVSHLLKVLMIRHACGAQPRWRGVARSSCGPTCSTCMPRASQRCRTPGAVSWRATGRCVSEWALIGLCWS